MLFADDAAVEAHPAHVKYLIDRFASVQISEPTDTQRKTRKDQTKASHIAFPSKIIKVIVTNGVDP